MKESAFNELKLKILGEYGTIISFCEATGIPRFRVYDMLSGKKSFTGYEEKIIGALNLTPEETKKYITQMNNYIGNTTHRKKLKLKIKGTYGTIKKFSEVSEISEPVVNYICAGRRDGTYDTWIKFQELLKIPDSEMWNYVKKEKVTDDER